MTAPVLDVLHELRDELGQESMVTVLVDRRPLLLRGALIGAAILVLALGTTALVFLRTRMVQGQTAQLSRFEAESNQLQASVAGSKAKLDKITATNRALTSALTTLRTSSALLSELQLRIPAGVQLISVEAKDDTLVVRGQAVDPLAFARINAMQLELGRSPLMQPKAVVLSKLERVPADTSADAIEVPGAVTFEMTGPFATLAPPRQLALLQKLGSRGMARRLQLLQSEGLIP